MYKTAEEIAYGVLEKVALRRLDVEAARDTSLGDTVRRRILDAATGSEREWADTRTKGAVASHLWHDQAVPKDIHNKLLAREVLRPARAWELSVRSMWRDPHALVAALKRKAFKVVK